MTRGLAVLLAVVAGVFCHEKPINVNRELDLTLAELAERVVASGDITADLGRFTAGGYTIQRARLGDISMIRRVGDAWMSSKGKDMMLNGSLTLNSMFMVGSQIGGGGRSGTQPLVTIGPNQLKFEFTVVLSWLNVCRVFYKVQLTPLSQATLYTDEPHFNDVDITKLININLAHINKQIQPIFTQLFERYYNLCESQHLLWMEMAKHPTTSNQDLQSFAKNHYNYSKH